MGSNRLQKIESTVLKGSAIEDTDDIVSLTTAFFTNLLAQVPVLSIFTGTAKDYFYEKVNKKRRKEIASFLDTINKRLKGVEIKQESIDYFESSLIFHLEEIDMKLISNPDKGFDQIFASFISSSLIDITSAPEEKDLVLSSLLSIDKLDIKVLKQIDVVFNKNLNQGKQAGADIEQLNESLKEGGINRLMISRSLERLQSQDIIHPLTTNTGVIQEQLTVAELHQGLKSKQYYPVSGFIVSEFGRTLMRLGGIKAI